MPRSETSIEKDAREAAERIDRDKALRDQLTFLPEDEADQVPEASGKGRPPGSKNKGSSQLRDWLASTGRVMPEERIAQMAGLDRGVGDPVEAAITTTERILAWAHDGAHIPPKTAPKPTAAQRIEVFKSVYAQQQRAAEALLPYGTPKASPDVSVSQTTTIVMAGGQQPAGQPGDQARDVTPKPSKLRPPPMPGETQQKQSLSDGPDPSETK